MMMMFHHSILDYDDIYSDNEEEPFSIQDLIMCK